MTEYSMHASAPKDDSVGASLPERGRDVMQKDRLSVSAPPDTRLLRNRLVRALLSASVVLVASILTLMFGEIVVRVFVPTERLVPLNEVMFGITALRPDIHGAHVIPHTFNVSYTTSAQRFRSSKVFAPIPDSHTLRVAVVGDSFTFGWGANDDATYPSDLERLLNSKYGPTEVLNAGIPGTGTGNEALWYDFWVRRFHPNLVVLTVVPNDVDDDLARPLFAIDASGNVHPKSAGQLARFQSQAQGARRFITQLPGYDYLTEHSELLNLFRRTTSLLIRRRHLKDSRASAGPAVFETVGLRLLGGEVTWLDQQVRSSGGQLVVVFVPFIESVYGPAAKTNSVVSASAAMVATLTRVCAQDNIPFRDITSEMRSAGASGQQPLYYTKYDAHPTPAGYRLIADLVSPLVLDELHSHGDNTTWNKPKISSR
jgi:lysophospholipase L1-like esterase